MKVFFVLFFAGFVAFTHGLGNLDVVTGVVGNVLEGGDEEGAAADEANGKLPVLGAKKLISVSDALKIGGNGPVCIKLCPTKIADENKKCIKPTDFPGKPMCYQINPRNKYIWPCVTDLPPAKDDD